LSKPSYKNLQAIPGYLIDWTLCLDQSS